MVDAAIDGELEILRDVTVLRLGIGERVEEAHALDRLLLHAVQRQRRRDAGQFIEGRHDVDHMEELAADTALVLDARRPRYDHRVARAAKVAGHLLGPLKGRVHRVRPGRREMVEIFRSAKVVDGLEIVLPCLGEAVEEEVLVDRTLDAALRTRAIVAGNVDEQRVLGVGQLLHRIDDAAHVIIDVRAVGGEHLHHAGIDLLLIDVERIPRREARRAFGELGVRWHDAELLLSGQRFFAVLVPAHVELALEAGNPVGRCVVR